MTDGRKKCLVKYSWTSETLPISPLNIKNLLFREQKANVSLLQLLPSCLNFINGLFNGYRSKYLVTFVRYINLLSVVVKRDSCIKLSFVTFLSYNFLLPASTSTQSYDMLDCIVSSVDFKSVTIFTFTRAILLSLSRACTTFPCDFTEGLF